MDRRNFLTRTGMAMVAVTLLPRKGYTFFTPSIDGVDSCVPTTADILGPFYRAGSPVRTNLQVTGEPGTAFIFKGVISDEQCNPIANATVDVWQADDGGEYDNSTPDYDNRGIQITDSSGSYEFLSILPGWYLNGATYRPRHIHFRVTAPGFTELITQLYFEGDPYIATDPWASDPDAVLRIVPITNVGGTDTAVFNIALPGVLGIDDLNTDDKVTSVPGPDGTVVIRVNGEVIRHAEVFDVSGRLVNAAYEIGQEQYTVRVAPRAVYFIRLDVGGKILVHKFMAP